MNQSTESMQTLLLVDDEEGIRKVLGIALEDIGYHVITAENGRRGLELFREQRPAIVITDIKMPVMDGVDLLQRIKAENSDTEVIVLTGHGDMDLAIKCLKLEATDFVTKPINDDAMEIALKRANDKIRMRGQLQAYTENLERLVQEKTAQLVAAERRAAVGQAVESLSSAIQNITSDLNTGIQTFNNLPCFVSIHSPQLTVVAANQRYVEKLGDPTGKQSWWLYASEQGAQRTPCPAEKTFQTGRGQRLKVTATLPDGTHTDLLVHTAPIRNAAGEVELVVEIAADVAEIRRLQDELRTTQQRYEQLFNEAPCYITVQDREMRITAANQRFVDDFGSPGHARCWVVYQQRQDACPDCPVRKTFADGNPHQVEMDVIGRNGARYRMLIWTAPLRDHTGRITHVMEMSKDVTAMRQLQDQLSSLGLMIGSVSHGIKGLLTGLDGGMYLLDSGFSNENLSQIKEGWDIVRLMISRIRALVLDILYYAKEKDLKWERVDVLAFASDISEQIRPKTERHTIDLICDFDSQLKEFEVDAGILRAALTNVLENAIAACTEDSEAGKRHCIEFIVTADNKDVRFEVRDNGIGMDETTRSRVFTAHFISRKKEGSGLGLFLTSEILKHKNGDISLQSQPGRGTRVTIRLPRTPLVAVRTEFGGN
jgi:signal transduction histidine kinase/FixJ family two-component response regulator